MSDSTTIREVVVDASPVKEEVVASPAKPEEPVVSMSMMTADYWKSIVTPDAPPTNPATAAEYAALGPAAPAIAAINNWFRIKDRGSTFWTEFSGGMTTFFSMCYIMALNGIILNAGKPWGTGISVNGAFFATALSSGIFTFIMGVAANAPIALAPGMGLNGYFASIVGAGGLAIGKTLDLPNALGAVFLSGVFYAFFTVTGLRSAIFTAIPHWMRIAIGVGVGFFITMIGLKIGEIETVSAASWATSLSLNPIPFAGVTNGIAMFNSSGAARLSVLGLAFIIFFSTLKTPGAVIISIILTTLCGINYGLGTSTLGDSKAVDAFGNSAAVTPLQGAANWYNGAAGYWLPDMASIPSGILRFNLANTPLFWEAVWTFLAVELFDSFGTIVSTVSAAGLYNKESKGNTLVNRAMAVDGFGLMLGAVIGSNSITCYVESLTGIAAGARTGFASVVTGSAFLLSLLFIRPFVAIIPDAATCCALVYVGACAIRGLKDIDWASPVQVWCTFLTIAIMGFTYSIFNGICFSMIAFCIIQITLNLAHRLSEAVPRLAPYFKPTEDHSLPHPLMVVMSIFFVFRFRYLGL